MRDPLETAEPSCRAEAEPPGRRAGGQPEAPSSESEGGMAPRAASFEPRYVGRFAPSPTGSMHLGIARTALAAWLDARAHDGRFLVRMEDIDAPRVVPGSAEGLLRDLEWLGLTWDDQVVFQSERQDRYLEALEALRGLDRLYACTCSRREIREASAPHGASDEGPRYPGTCRNGARPRPERVPAIRFRTEPSDTVGHVDRRLGPLDQDVHEGVGDFILRRADALWAYQLAVTVDDLEQGITCVTRGEDLASSTPRQLLLRRVLAKSAAPLDTLHVPLLLGADGRRLAKRDGSFSVATARAEGTPAEVLVGRLAASLGLIEAPEPCPPDALIPAWRARLPAFAPYAPSRLPASSAVRGRR